jgi:hypothetical protein
MIAFAFATSFHMSFGSRLQVHLCTGTGETSELGVLHVTEQYNLRASLVCWRLHRQT